MSIDRILRWFPSAWRSRYEAEVRDLLAAHPCGWNERVDLIRACADAWLRQGATQTMTLGRFTAFYGVRLVAVLAVGYAGISGAEAVVSMTVVEPVPVWLAQVSRFVKLFMIAYVGIVVLRPALENSNDQPGRLEALVYPALFLLCVATDGRPAHAGGALWFGVLATMRVQWVHRDRVESVR